MFRATSTGVSQFKVAQNARTYFTSLRRVARRRTGEYSESQRSYKRRFTTGSILAAVVGIGGYTIGKHFTMTLSVKPVGISSCDEGPPDCVKHEILRKKGGKWHRSVAENVHLCNAIKESKDLVQTIKDEVGSPGLIICVSVDGKEIWSDGLGYADVENRVPCTANTVMRIASISKPITMAIVAKLWEAGQLDLDKSVTEYVESWPVKEFNKEKVTITTRQLVSHLGGIRHYDKSCKKKKDSNSAKKQKSGEEKVKDGEKDEDTKKKDKSASEKSDKSEKEKNMKVMPEFQLAEYHIQRHYDSVKQSLKLFKDDAMCSKPDTEYLYTTHGWTLIAAVTEGASGKTYPDLLKGLLKDLGMEKTYLDENDRLIYNRARYYNKNARGRLVNAPHVDCSYKWAGGGVVSTVKDLNKFGNAMLYSHQHGSTWAPASHDDARLPGYLRPETVAAMWTPVEKALCDWDSDGHYGMGWGVVPGLRKHGACRDQRFYVSHTGGAIGASSVLLVLPRKPETLTSDKASPRGVVVSIIVNMQSVGLNKVALDIAKKFEELDL